MNDRIYKLALRAEKQGKWQQAHDMIQDVQTEDAAWIHAYLHRKEGDQWNAAYWYRRAKKPVFNGSLEEEWQLIWDHFES